MSVESLFALAANAIARGAEIVERRSLGGERGPWLIRAGSTTAVLKVMPREDRPYVATEVAALEFAEKHDVAAPRVIAVDLDGPGGVAVLLSTFLHGSTRLSLTADPERLRALGAAAAAFHRLPLTPTPDLPLRERHMPWVDFAAERLSGEQPTTPLLDEAGARVRELTRPRGETVFVHADLWLGNMMWDGDRHTGTIDWDAAGTGHYGVDLGSLRFDAAIHFGIDAADEVLRGWHHAYGREATDVGYWDLVAALNTPARMDGSLPAIHENTGRTDLDGQTLTDRRDEFLRAALNMFDG